ncbi:MAG TPA: chorismate mutase [Gaiellaceae bacterium]|jgi:chorismate mutase|nr:chorismate mutase [Gaiellaceae bacterium]
MTDDPILNGLRDQVSAFDRAIVEAVNHRLELVAKIKAYKDSQGLGFLDPRREEQMLDELARSNRGPLSEQGLRELLQAILDLSKREVTSGESA